MTDDLMPTDGEDDAIDDRQLQEMPMPRCYEDVLEFFDDIDPTPYLASPQIEKSVQRLKGVRESIEALQKLEKAYKDEIAIFMLNRGVLINGYGETILTFNRASPRKTFDAKRFQQDHKNLYDQYVKVAEIGTRNFVVGK